jgi:hypothetical protein
MAAVSCKRVWLGALVGGIAWIIWSGIVHMVILADHYAGAQKAGVMLSEPRYGFFLPVYFACLLIMAYVLAWLYAGVRATFGAGPATALKVGALAGFAIAFPLNFSAAAWDPVGRIFPFWWMIELWVGAILATLIAGWLYRDD